MQIYCVSWCVVGVAFFWWKVHTELERPLLSERDAISTMNKWIPIKKSKKPRMSSQKDLTLNI